MPLSISRKHDTRTNLRISKILFGRASLTQSPVLDTNVTNPDEVISNDSGVLVQQAQTTEIITDLFADDRPFMPNDDEFKNPLPLRGLKKWKRRLRKIKNLGALIGKVFNDKEIPLADRIQQLFMFREYTYGERLEIIEADERRRLVAFHQDASKRMGKMIINTLSNLGLCDWFQQEGKGNRKIKKTVQFDWVDFSPLVYRYHVDARRLPWKINLFDLYQQPVVTTLSGSAGHPIRARNEVIADQVTGLIYEVEIAATLGIPNKCYFADLLPRIPDSAPALAFLVGYTENKRVNWQSLEDMPHLLGGGQTNGGKSNMMHVMICTFIARNKPEDLRLAMVDLKFDGIELSRYEDCPHMITEIDGVPKGVAANAKEALAVLRWADAESERRGRMFKAEKTQNIKIWNRKHSKRHLARIVIAMDELALLRTDREHGGEAYELIRGIASTARASGIHIMAFTQSSNKRIVDEMVKVNFPGRICFSVPDHSSSILFVNDGSAINLMPAGRAIFKHGTTNYITQTPLIEPGEIDQIVRNAKKGELTTKIEAVHLSPEEIIEWAIEGNNSSLKVRDVINKFSTRADEHSIEKILKDMDGGQYDVGDRRYQVIPGTGKKPRNVIRIGNIGVYAPENSRVATRDTENHVTHDEEVTEET